MSIMLGKLCSLILHEHFGELVCIVGENLFTAYAKTLPLIVKSTNLSKSEVVRALAILIKFRLVKFEPTIANENVAEYALLPDRILLLLRYSKYVHLIQSKFGSEAALLTEELLRSGNQFATAVIAKAVSNIENMETQNLIKFRDKFNELITSNFFIRSPILLNSENFILPKFDESQSTFFSLPEVDLQEITTLISNPKGKIKSKDEDIYWQINFERFHQEFRDTIIISAIERKIDSNASECIKFVLQKMYSRTEPWQQNSNPIPFVEIKQACEKGSNNLNLIRYLDQYISIILEDQLKVLKKYGDSGGGQYVVQMKSVFEQLTWCCIDNIIIEKFGTKAARIFRVARNQKYIEQEEIQKQAMVPAKEAKQITYQLLEEHFLQIHTVRKTGGGGSGPAKSFYLFYVNQVQIVSMLLETCYKSLFNTITRTSHDKTDNKRLIDKSQRLEGIVEAMKDRGESEEYISEILETLTPPEREILQKFKIRIKMLYSAEIGLDETILLLQLYLFYAQEAKKQ